MAEPITALPLFPLGTVLYPGGLLPLRIFEVRYLDMIGKCHRAGTPFGVVGLTQGAEVRVAGAEAEQFAGIGTVAHIRSFESPQPGLETAYEGVTLGPDGRLDVARIRRNVSVGGGEALSRAMTLEAIDAFVAYALFSARNVLPGEMSERLLRGYRDLQEGLS